MHYYYFLIFISLLLLLTQNFTSSLKIIEKAIVNLDLGLTPNNDGEAIRLTIPQLTSDRRKVSLLYTYIGLLMQIYHKSNMHFIPVVELTAILTSFNCY